MRIALRLVFLTSCFLTLPAIYAADTGSQLHSDVQKLIEVSGMQQTFESSIDQMISQGKAAMVQQKPQLCDSRFVDEWARRMREQIKAGDFLQVVENVYEKYFSDGEIKELIELRTGKEKTPSSDLKSKMDKVGTSVQSEIMGGCTQVGSNLGAEIGKEVQKEHPDYCKQ